MLSVNKYVIMRQLHNQFLMTVLNPGKPGEYKLCWTAPGHRVNVTEKPLAYRQ